MTSEKFGDALASTPHLGTISGTALIIFSYFGFESIVNLAEETKKPERDLPLAILLSLAISTVLYVLVSLSAGLETQIFSEERLSNPKRLQESGGPGAFLGRMANLNRKDPAGPSSHC